MTPTHQDGGEMLTKEVVQVELQYIESHDAPNHAMPRKLALEVCRAALQALTRPTPQDHGDAGGKELTVPLQLFLEVFAQACGSFENPHVISHDFISSYENACDWLCEHGLADETGSGCRLHNDPFDLSLPSTDRQKEQR